LERISVIHHPMQRLEQPELQAPLMVSRLPEALRPAQQGQY
jgi:hypothetical protein